MVINKDNLTGIHKVVRNSVFNTSSWGINVLLTFIATPYIVSHLHLEGYGIYALLTGLLGYYNLFDFGIGQGVIKYVSEFNSKGKTEAINQSIKGALFVEFLAGSLSSIALVLFASSIIKLLNIPEAYWRDATLGIYASALGFFFSMISSTISSALLGFQRYDLTSASGVMLNIVLNIATVFILFLGFGLKEVIYLSVLSSFLTLLINTILLKSVFPELNIRGEINFSDLRKLFNFSFFMFLSEISGLFYNYVVRFVVSAFLGPAMVTYYVVPSKVINAIGGFLSGSSAVLFPFASELSSREDLSKVRELFISGSKLFASLSIPLYLTLLVASKPILSIWMGTDFAERGWGVLSLLALGSFIGSLSTIPNLLTMGLGRSRTVGLYSLLNVILYAIFLPLFTDLFSVNGTALAVALVSLPSILLISYEAKSVVSIDPLVYLRSVLRFHAFPTLISLLLALLFSSYSYSSKLSEILIPLLYFLSYCTLLIITKEIPLKKIVDRFKVRFNFEKQKSL